MKNNNKGFTLAELLIVVAIIAVLVAVSIPTFNNQLEKSRQSTDLSNLRGAYAAAKIAELNGEVPAFDANEKEANPVKIGLPSAWKDTMATDYSSIGYAFWYDGDTGRLYLDTRFDTTNYKFTGTDASMTEIQRVQDDNSIKDFIKTSLKARSTKRVVDTTNLPGGSGDGTGIIQYHPDTTPANGDLPGDSDSSWPSRRILVVFFNDNGIWSLKKGSIRFADISSTATQVSGTDEAPYNGNKTVPVAGFVSK